MLVDTIDAKEFMAAKGHTVVWALGREEKLITLHTYCLGFVVALWGLGSGHTRLPTTVTQGSFGNEGGWGRH